MSNEPSPEFSTISRFASSLGLLCVVGAGIIGWALLQPSAVLTFQEEDLAQLTDLGADTVINQQVILSSLVSSWACIAIGLVALGLLLLAAGAWTWGKRERVEAKRAAELHLIQLRKATRAERDEDARRAGAADAATTSGGDRSNQGFRASYDFYRMASAQIESALMQAFSGTHRVESDIRMSDKDGEVRVDFALIAYSTNGETYAIELLAARNTLTHSRVIRALKSADRAVAALRPLTRGDVRGVALAIIGPEVYPPNYTFDPEVTTSQLIVVSDDNLEKFIARPELLRGLLEL